MEREEAYNLLRKHMDAALLLLLYIARQEGVHDWSEILEREIESGLARLAEKDMITREESE